MVSRKLCLIALASLGLVACEQSRTALEGRVLDAGDACESDSECDDGLVCSGLERCLDGRCWSGRPPACDDGDSCTSDSCLEPLGCEFRPLTSAVCSGANNSDAGVAEDAGPTSGFVPRFPEYCAQGQVNGDVLVSTQASLDALQGVRCIDGDLRVLGPEVYSLTALAHLRFVAGDLVVRDTTSLKTFDGLESLEKVERHLIVEGMQGVSYQAPFRQLASVGGDLKLSKIVALQELAGFSTLTRVGGHLQLAEFPQLSELSGAFSALRSVGGDVSLKSSPKLTHFDGLNALTFVGGSVTMGSDSMTRLTGFEGLETVVGPLVLSGALTTLGAFPRLREAGILGLHLPLLREYEGLQNLTRASGVSVIAPQLTHLRAFASLRSAGQLGLVNLPKLQELTGLSKLERTGDLTLKNTALLRWPFTSLTTAQTVTLEDNPRLYDVDGLISLTSFTRLIVRNNPSLQSLAVLKGPADLFGILIEGNLNLYDPGLSSLKNIEVGLYVRANPNLSRCEADRLAGLYRGPQARLSISSNLGCAQCNGPSCATAPSVADGQSTHLTNLPPNPDMRSLRNVQTVDSFSLIDYVGETVPLPNLTRVGNLSLRNTSLRDLTVLANLEEVTGIVEISDNKQLESLAGMANLRTVGGTFDVVRNPKLSALGLDALESIGGAISFREDAELSVCQVYALENQLSGAPKAAIYKLQPCSGACVAEVCQ